jgi:hypothetical protein
MLKLRPHFRQKMPQKLGFVATNKSDALRIWRIVVI